MYSRFELKIATAMAWTARLATTVIAVGLLAVAVRLLIGDDGTFGGDSRGYYALLAAGAYVLVWRFPLACMGVIVFAAFRATRTDFATVGLPDYLSMFLLLPLFLSVGGWLRQREYMVVRSRRETDQSTPI